MAQRSQLPTPDSISGQRNIGTPFSDLQPGAKPFSAFQAPTVADVGGIPQDNSISQLGKALTHLNPALAQVGGEVAKNWTAKEIAQAEADSRKHQAENIRGIKEATEKGLIPAGASPTYIKAYNMTDLDTKSMRFANGLFEEYQKSGLPDNDDPEAFDKFVTEYTAGKRKEYLTTTDGKDQYSVLELKDSKFDEKITGSVQGLRSQHIQHRVAERTKLGEEIVSTNASTKLDAFTQVHPDDRDWQRIGAVVRDSFFNPVTGLAEHGLTKSKAGQLMVDVVTQKMIDTGDTSWKEVLQHIGTSENNILGKNGYARKKVEEADNHIISNQIRNDNFAWTKRERNALERVGLTPEEQARIKLQDEQHKQELWKRADQQYEHSVWQIAKSERESGVNIQTEAESSIILTGLEAKDMNNPKVKKSLDWLKKYNPDKWMTMNTYIKGYQKEAHAFKDTTGTDLAAAQLRYDMSRSPQTFNMTKIIEFANDGMINPSKVQPLLDDWDKIKTHQQHPFIQSEEFKDMKKSARRAAMKDAGDEYGPAAIMAEDSAMKLSLYAAEWIKHNPDGQYDKFISDTKNQLKGLVLDTSPQFAKDEAAAKDKKETVTTKPPDTRSIFEKVAPNAIGGKSAPKPVTKKTGPAPLTPSQAFGFLKPQDSEALQQALQDPNTDDEHADAAIRYFLGPVMRSNGRDAVEFQKLKDLLLQSRTKPQ